MIRVCMRPMELATLQSLHIPISESFSPNPTTPNLSKTCWFGLMAQKTEKEETEFKVPESLASTSGIGGGISSCSNTTQQKKVETLTHGRSRNERIKLEVVRRNEPAGSDPVKKAVNRCDGCNRKVGLTGFRCRCGELFCWEHRYSDRHDCSFDYKTAGREAIARENPVVKAAKILRV